MTSIAPDREGTRRTREASARSELRDDAFIASGAHGIAPANASSAEVGFTALFACERQCHRRAVRAQRALVAALRRFADRDLASPSISSALGRLAHTRDDAKAAWQLAVETLGRHWDKASRSMPPMHLDPGSRTHSLRQLAASEFSSAVNGSGITGP